MPGFCFNLFITFQLAQKVADRLDTDPMMLQFFRGQTPRDIAGSVVPSTFDGQLKDILMIYGTRKQSKRLYYQQLTMKVDEFENKRQFRCIFVSPSLKEEEMILYPNKSGSVASLLEECRKKLNIDDEFDLRLLEVTGNRICAIFPRDKPLDEITSYLQSPRMYRIEIIPDDQKEVGEDEALICIAHFQKEIYNTFGTPLLVKIKTGERFTEIKERIQRCMNVPDSTFFSYKTAVIIGSQVKYMGDGIDITINLKDVLPPASITNSQHTKLCTKAWIGLDHTNKNTKRQQSRFGYTEKAIKIHN